MATIFVYLESAVDTPLTSAAPTLDYWDKSAPGAPTTGVAMTELTTGIGGGYFVDVATADGVEYLGIIDGTAGAKAGSRYHTVAFSGTTDERIEVDIPAILVDTDATLPAAIAAVQADTDDIQTRLPAALVGGRMDADVAVIQANVVNASALATDAVNEIRDSILSDSTPFDGADIAAILLDTGTTLPARFDGIEGAGFLTATDSLEAIRNQGDAAWLTATGFAVAGDAMTLTAAAVDLIWDELQAGHATPGSFGVFLDAAISGVTGIVDWSAAEREQIRSALGVDGTKTAAVSGQLQDMQGAGFLTATDSLEAIRNQGDAAWLTATGFATPANVTAVITQGDIAWTTATGFAVAGDAMTLTAAAVDLIWDELQAGHAVAGSFGLYLDAAISSIAGITPQAVRDAMKLAPTGGAPAAGSVDTHLDDILADTAAIEPLVSTNLDVQLSTKGGGAWDSVAVGFATPANVTAVITQGDIAWTTATGFAVAGDAMTLTAAAVDLIWDELQAGHAVAGSFGLYLDAPVSTAGSPAAIAAAVWAYDVTANFDGLTDRDMAGGALLWARILDTNRQELDTTTDRLNVYDDAGTGIISFAPLADHTGGTIVGAVGSPARRTAAFS